MFDIREGDKICAVARLGEQENDNQDEDIPEEDENPENPGTSGNKIG